MMARQILSASALSDRRQDGSSDESAACLGADTELFIPVSFTGAAVADIQAAKAYCGRCQVRDCCLTYARDAGQTAGIWGGYVENERRTMRRGQCRYALMRSTAGGRRP
jgi:WhiB family transcriptional regulator, redox-sensing transcriptional regulator